jgi:hypothetical protein
LFDATTALLDWAARHGLTWDVMETEQGDRWGARLEIYETDLAQERGQRMPGRDSSAGWHAGRPALIRRSAMTHPPDAQPGYRRTPLSAEEKARGEANFTPIVAQTLVASGRFRVSADTPDQVELFQGVARRVSEMLQRSVVSYANGREIVITFGPEEAPALALRSLGWAFPASAGRRDWAGDRSAAGP